MTLAISSLGTTPGATASDPAIQIAALQKQINGLMKQMKGCKSNF